MVKQSLYCQEIWKTVATQETNYFHTNVLYCGRCNQVYFKIAQIGTPDKKPFSNLLMSREFFLCAKTARNLLRDASIVKKIGNKVPERQTNSIEMSYIVEGAAKSISELRKLEQQSRNRFQTKLCLENLSFFKNC